MKKQLLKFRTNHIFGLVTIVSLNIGSPTLWANEHPGDAGARQGAIKSMDKADDAGQAWASIQQLVKDMETLFNQRTFMGFTNRA